MEPEVLIDVSMAFNIEFQDDLNNPESDLYMETSEMATAAFQQMLATTTAKLVDQDTIDWVFTEGSVVATALGVSVTNVQNADEVTQQLEDFDVSTIPNLQSITATIQIGKIHICLTISQIKNDKIIFYYICIYKVDTHIVFCLISVLRPLKLIDPQTITVQDCVFAR